jgi:dipeptidyl aminopeptidase/acylaminoacyl peptidase
LKTFATERLFRSDNTSYESVVTVLDDNASKVLTRHETRTQPPNYLVRDLKAGSKQAVTQFTSVITAAELRLPQAEDVQLSGTLHCRRRAGRAADAHGPPARVVDPISEPGDGSPNRFTTVSGASHLLLLTQGYAIFDGPTMPIVGPGETANDTYVEQLVASAVDKAVEMALQTVTVGRRPVTAGS